MISEMCAGENEERCDIDYCIKAFNKMDVENCKLPDFTEIFDVNQKNMIVSKNEYSNFNNFFTHDEIIILNSETKSDSKSDDDGYDDSL